MPQLIYFLGAGRAALSRSVRVRHSKENALSQGGTGQGIHHQTQQGDAEFALLATDRAAFVRIRELQAAQTTALSKEPPNVDAYYSLQSELTQASSRLSPPAIKLRDAEREARGDGRIRIEQGYQAYANAEWLARRRGTGPADEAWQTYLNECRQAKEIYSVAVAKAKADYLAKVAGVNVQRGRQLESYLAESFNGLDDDAALNRRDAA